MDVSESENLKFTSLPEFSAGIYASMLKEIFEKEGIACYISNDGLEGAVGVTGTFLTNKSLKLYVPEDKYDYCLNIQQEILGNS